MENTLEELSKKEFALMSDVFGLYNSTDTYPSFKSSFIEKAYNQIYLDYHEFYWETKNVEALKRIIFIQWYAVSEPAYVSGINVLDLEKERLNLTETKFVIQEGTIDEEFSLMLFHYYNVSDWYFDSFCDFSKHIEEIKAKYEENYPQDKFSDRGQMGDYWRTILQSQLKRDRSGL